MNTTPDTHTALATIGIAMYTAALTELGYTPEAQSTGGGCWALCFTADGYTFMVTDQYGETLPTDPAMCLVGVYDDGDQKGWKNATLDNIGIAIESLRLGPLDVQQPRVQRQRGNRVFCSLDCNREYHTVVAAYPGDGHEAECQNCGAPLEPEPDLPDGDAYDQWVERRLTRPAPQPDTLTGMVGR